MAAIEDRKYQTDAIESVRTKWREGFKRVLLVMPTGAGKGTVFCQVTERLLANGKTMTVMAHRRNLVKQLAERLIQFGIPYRVEMAGLPSESWVRQDHNPRVYVVSKDTLISRCRGGNFDHLPVTDLLTIDESHRCEESGYSELVSRFPAKHWLGLTATPIRPDGTGLGSKNWDALVVGATVPGLVKQNYLVPVKVYVPPGLSQRRIEGKKTKISGDPVEWWMRFAEGKRTIAFLPGVAAARAAMDKFNAAGVPAAILSADSSNEERADILGKVKDGKIRWLGNVDLFTEGMDCPELEVCQILRKMESMRAYIQAVGRVLRPAPWIGKTQAILLDHSAASAIHRYPEVEPEWRLDESGEEFHRRHAARVKKELGDPIDCKKCGAVFAGVPKCPYCGEPLPPSRKRKELVYEAEGLAPAGAKAAVAVSKEQKAWDRILWAARYRGLTCGAAFMMFKEKVKMTPQAAGVRPLFGFHQKDMPVGLAEQSFRR